MLGFAERLFARSGLALVGAACAILLLGCSEERAQADGEEAKSSSGEITETRDLPAFTRIRVDGAAGLEIEVGKPQRVEIEADADLMERVSTEVVDGTLEIRIDQKVVILGHNNVGFRIAMEKLEGFALNGAAGAQITGVDSETFDLSLDGAGGIDVSGTCGTASYSIDGAGGLSAAGLKCQNVSISLDGAGGADVYASESFSGSIDGIGGIDVKGSPKQVVKSVDGLGAIDIE